MQQEMVKKNGFTLIEIMIVMSVMAFLVAGGMVGYQSSRQEATMRAAKREVAAVMRLAQSFALQGRAQDMGGSLGKRTPCGYGFEFTTVKNYRIFYTYKNTSDPDNTCKENRIYPGYEYNRKTAKIGSVEQKFTLPDNVDVSTSPIVNTRFYFTIPFGDVYTHNYKSGFDSKEIVLRYGGSTSTLTETIIINATGDVNEDED